MFGEETDGHRCAYRSGGSRDPSAGAGAPRVNADHFGLDDDNDAGNAHSGVAGGGRPKTVEEIIRKLDADQDLSAPGPGRKGGCCARLFLPLLTVVMLVVVCVATVQTSGTTSDVAAKPRVALIVVEGLQGDVLQAMLASPRGHAPNIASLITTQRGAAGVCPKTCARAPLVEAADGSVSVSAAASIATILSGVSPAVHGVHNDTARGVAAYATTSTHLPSVAMRVTQAGMTVAALGGAQLLNSFTNTASMRCADPGVLDMECISDTAAALAAEGVLNSETDNGATTLDCLSTQSCNTARRRVRLPPDASRLADGSEEQQFTQQLLAMFGGLAFATTEQETAQQNPIADNLDDSLFLFHFNALARRAASPALPDFYYSTRSAQYEAQVYLIDSLVGQVAALLRDRARAQKENWLLLMVGAHGGSGKSFTAGDVAANAAVPFLVSTFLTGKDGGGMAVQPFDSAPSLADVLPTALRWLNVAPYDDATEDIVAGKNTTVASEAAEALLAERKKVLEGTVRGICSSGFSPVPCPTN